MLGIIIAILIGIISGLLFKSSFLLDTVDIFIKLGLSLLLFFVGIDIGNYKDLIKSLKKNKEKSYFSTYYYNIRISFWWIYFFSFFESIIF